MSFQFIHRENKHFFIIFILQQRKEYNIFYSTFRKKKLFPTFLDSRNDALILIDFWFLQMRLVK